MAIVGARAASSEGQEFAFALAQLLAEAKIDVISGGALGIDAAAHRGALSGKGATVAVLGTGIDVVYPQRHRKLFDEIVAAGGALLTPFPPGQAPCRWTFPARNQLIAALCDWVVVVEASSHSGTLHTTRAALRMGKKIAARPGSPGAQALLSQGATSILKPSELIDCIRGQAPVRRSLPPGHPLTQFLDDKPQDLMELSARSKIPFADCARLLAELEIEGLVLRAPGGRYRTAGKI